LFKAYQEPYDEFPERESACNDDLIGDRVSDYSLPSEIDEGEPLSESTDVRLARELSLRYVDLECQLDRIEECIYRYQSLLTTRDELDSSSY
jgi:hypothetical protein